MLISSVSDFFLIFEKGFWIRRYFPPKNRLYLPLKRRLLISEISAPQFASFFLKNAHYRDYRSHLSGFCGFACNFIGLRSFTKGCIDNFNSLTAIRFRREQKTPFP
jgi:hypothetical protein